MTAAFFSQYGKLFGTHRLFRQYFWALAGPFLMVELFTRNRFVDNVNLHWAVHANRLNEGHLEDPQGTQVPLDVVLSRAL